MQGTGHSTEQSCQPGGKRTSFCTAATLFWALSQHISEQDTSPGCPLCPRACSQPPPCQGSAPAPKVPCKWRGMGLQRGTGLQPHPPTFRPQNPHLRHIRAPWLTEHPLSSPRPCSTQHNWVSIPHRGRSIPSPSRDWCQLLPKPRKDKPAQCLGSTGRTCSGIRVSRTC